MPYGNPTTKWFIELLVRSLAVFIVTYILPGISIKNFGTALIVALVYGILKTLFAKILVLFTLPLMILSLGLFWFVINAFLLWITDKLIDSFEIRGFFMTLVAAFLISLIDMVLRWVIPGI